MQSLEMQTMLEQVLPKIAAAETIHVLVIIVMDACH